MPSYYVSAYDTEMVYPWWKLGNIKYTSSLYEEVVSYEGESLNNCIDGIRTVAEVHKTQNAPATFFIVAKLAEAAKIELRSILDDPLFEIGCHSYSHADIVEIQNNPKLLHMEIFDAKKILEDIFGCQVNGYTTPGAYEKGLTDYPAVRDVIHSAGFSYVRSWGKGSMGALPAPLTQPFFYAEGSQSRLLEIGLHAWHDNVLCGQPFPLVWPRELPWNYPSKPAETPVEAFDAYKPGIDYIKKKGLLCYVPCFHPWSIFRLNAEAEHISMLLSYAKKEIQVSRCDYIDRIFRENTQG